MGFLEDGAKAAAGDPKAQVKIGSQIGAFGCATIIFLSALLFSTGYNKSGLNTEEAAASEDAGSLTNVSDIPDSLKPIFNAAGQKYKVSPALVAAIFYKEHGETFPTKGPWTKSNSGANGPFQFLEPTWEGWSSPYRSNGTYETSLNTINKYNGYGKDGDDDNKADVQNLWDSAFAAASLLGANGAAPNVSNIEKLKNAASLYNSGEPWSIGQGISETADYVPAVIAAYQKFLNQM